MKRNCPYSVVDLLPHKPPMVLLDTVLGWDDDRLEAEVVIRPDSPFFRPGKGVPVHVGIEYMAQACGVFAGLEAKESEQPVRIGFLLGTRQYRANIDWFTAGMRLAITVTQVFRDGAMGVFDCSIMNADGALASAQLNVYQPEDAHTILNRKN